MNITEEIIKRLGKIGFSWQISEVLTYFLCNNLNDLLGTDVVSENDVELILANCTIEFKCIYSEKKYILSIHHNSLDETSTIICDEIGKESRRVFEITESSHIIENRFTSKDGIQKKYTYDKTKVSFSLEIIHEDIDKPIIDYKGVLTPIYSKTKDADWFTYKREYPPKGNGESILKRIVEELSGRGCSRKIITSDDATIDLDKFSDRIFETLINDAKMVLQTNENCRKKRIRT